MFADTYLSLESLLLQSDLGQRVSRVLASSDAARLGRGLTVQLGAVDAAPGVDLVGVANRVLKVQVLLRTVLHDNGSANVRSDYLPSDAGEFAQRALFVPVANEGTLAAGCELVVRCFDVTCHNSCLL